MNGGSSSKTPLALNANGAYNRNNKNRSFRKNRTPEELAELKKRTKCDACGKTGHWKGDSDCDKISDSSQAPKNTTFGKKKTGTVSFHMANLKPFSASSVEDQLGPLVDDGAPYSSMGIYEFRELQRVTMPTFNGAFDPLPPSVAD